ncbi:unnamed protein product [Trifolium pratense]|uniref:Uncharacterized protein n=1 Tax=Trifolium pratense TaxID=57577 RepID=A0ACB0LAY0_TRIPR|nr:unnamed protein product [Trifolium pratense]
MVRPAGFTMVEPVKTMEARVEALQGEISEVRSTLVDVQKAMKESHTSLIAMMEKCFGKSVVEEEGASVVANTTAVVQILPEKTKESSSGELGGETLTEFCHSVKVELPSFTGTDPIAWMVRAEKSETINSKLSVKMCEMHRRAEQVFALEPPPEPPDLSVSDQPLVVLPRRRPQPKPPEANKYVDVNGSMVKIPPPSVSPVPDSSVSIVGSAMKRSSMTRTKLMEKEDRGVEPVFGNLSPIVSLMGLTQTNFNLPGQKKRVHVNLIHGLNPMGPIQVTFFVKLESQTRCFLCQSIACTLRSGSPESLDGKQFATVPPKPPDPNLFITVGYIQKILNLVATTQLREIIQRVVASPTPGSSTFVLPVKTVAWLSKEKGENRNYCPLDIEVLITKALLVGERLSPKSIRWNSFLSGCPQQERYVEVFEHFIYMQYVDSPLLLNENVTHGCVVRICVNGDGLVPNVNDKGYGQKGYVDFALKMMSLHSEDFKLGFLTWVFLNQVLSPKYLETRITLLTCVWDEKYFERFSKVKIYSRNGSVKESFSVSDNSFCKTFKYAIDCNPDHTANDGNVHNEQHINLLLTWFDFLVMDCTLAYNCSAPVTSFLLLCELTKDYRILFLLRRDVGLASWVPSMTNQAKESDAHNKTNLASGYSSILHAEHNDEGNWRQSSEGNGLRAWRISPDHRCSFTNVEEILQTEICVLVFGIWAFTQSISDNTTLCKRSMLVGDLYVPRLMISGNHSILPVVIGDLLISLNSEEGCCSCKTVHVTWLFEGGLSSFQGDSRGNDLILNYYCTQKVLMQMVANGVLLVIKFLERKKEYTTSNAPMFVITVLNSSTMAIPWDPGKFNTFMTGVAYQCLRNFLSIYGLLNLVLDRGKIWLKSILVLLMLVYDRGKFWSSSIWVQVMIDLIVFHGLIPMCFSSELKGRIAARRVIGIMSNLEDKVVLKGWVLIETKYE